MSWAGNVAYTSVPACRHPALLAAGVIAAGIVAGDQAGWQPSTWAVFCVTGLLVILLLPRSQGRPTELARVLAILAFLFVIGGLRLSVERYGRPAPVLMELASSNRPVEVVGCLAGVPQSASSGWRAPFQVHGVRTRAGLMPVNALVLLNIPEPMDDLCFGDQLRMAARFRVPRIRRNPGGFDYAKYLFYRGIDALAKPVGPIARVERRNHRLSPYNLVEPMREWIRSTFVRYLSPTSRALILGFLLGDTEGLPAHVYQAVRNSGTLHLLAVSGANVWLIVGMALLPLRLLRVPRWPRTLMLLALVTLFSFLTRNEPSVVRASIMVGAILLGRLTYRPIAALNAVGVAGAIILICAPLQLFRPGFQLSFAAVGAIIVVTQRAWGRHRRRSNWAMAVSLSTLAATSVTAPILASHFGTVPALGLPANLVMIPIASVAAYLGVGLLVLSAVWSGAAILLAYPTTWTLELFAGVAGFFARLPDSVIIWSAPSVWSVANYYLPFVLILNWHQRYRWLRPTAYYGLLLVLVTLLLSLTSPDSRNPSLVLPDAGFKQAMAVGRPDGEFVWTVDAPSNDHDFRLWVAEPIMRAAFPGVKSDTTLSWFKGGSPLLAGSPVDRDTAALNAPLWRCYTSSNAESDASVRVWADLLAWGEDTLLLIRDLPSSSDLLDRIRMIAEGRDLLVIPAGASDPRIRSLIDRAGSKRVFFYGTRPWVKHPDQWLARWQILYPDTEFWSTAHHGGLVIEWARGGVRVCPTITNSAWQDPELQ